MTTVGELLAQGRRSLAAVPGSPVVPREAHLLLGHVLGLTEARLLAHLELPVAAAEAARFRLLVARRAAGEPAAYLVGEREFWGRRFRVDSRVLIPRPETEHIVELALAAELPASLRILDVGTGSGCLAVTLLGERADAHAVATDASPAALAVAAGNARRHEVADRLVLLATDIVGGLLLARFHLVVANLPYVDPAAAPTLPPDVREHEPALALYAGGGGLAVLGRLLRELGGPAGLAPGALILAEFGHGQEDGVRRLAADAPFDLREIRADHAGIPRVVVLRRR